MSTAVTGAPAAASPNGTITGSQSLSTPPAGAGLTKDDFLKLLVAQMKSQDPLSPTDSTAMVQQMTGFSQVDELTQLVALEQQNNQVLTQIAKDLAGATAGASSSTSATV